MMDQFYKELRKETLLLLCDTITAFPAYEKIIDEFRENACIVCNSVDPSKDYDKYDTEMMKLDKVYHQDLEKLVSQRLEKVEITMETLHEFFEATVRQDSEQILRKYPITEGVNEPTHVHRVRDLQMAYLSGIIQKLNPEKLEFTIPQSREHTGTITYDGQIGYNLSFDGELVINGAMQRFGRNLRKGKVTINGEVEELSVAPNVTIVLNGPTGRLYVAGGDVLVNGDVGEAIINKFNEKVQINGNVTSRLSYCVAVEQKPVVVTGNVAVADPGDAEILYKIIEKIQTKGKITVV